MQIWNHIIKDSEVIGIGPLMNREPKDPAQRDYGARQLFFLLYLRGYSIEVSSDWFELGTGDYITEYNKQERREYIIQQMGYQKGAKHIEEMISGKEGKVQPARPTPPKPPTSSSYAT